MWAPIVTAAVRDATDGVPTESALRSACVDCGCMCVLKWFDIKSVKYMIEIKCEYVYLWVSTIRCEVIDT